MKPQRDQSYLCGPSSERDADGSAILLYIPWTYADCIITQREGEQHLVLLAAAEVKRWLPHTPGFKQGQHAMHWDGEGLNEENLETLPLKLIDPVF